MLHKLQIQNFRALENVEIVPASGANLITGANGAGKTSLLEAIYVLMYGHSFRHRELLPLIRHDAPSFRVFMRFASSAESSHQLGMQRSRSNLVIRLDGASSVRRSDILGLLPLTWVGSNPQSLLTASPSNRRSFMDNGLFHVEHNYLAELKKYARALNQRNTALKNTPDTAHVWNSALDQSAQNIDGWRTDYMRKLADQVCVYMQLWQQGVAIEVEYQRGWPANISLIDVLQKSFATDKKYKCTNNGVHRADFIVRSNDAKTGKVLSRGQLKMLACAFYFAQMHLTKLKQDKLAVLLFDDLAAELDAENRARLLGSARDLYDQSFFTALSETDVFRASSPQKMFHVEHGNLVSR